MVKISWTILAVKDLEEIEAFIAKNSHSYAIITVEKIFKRIALLSKLPRSGRIVPEFENKDLRELIEGNYRIVYHLLSSKEISIIRIHHSSRLLK